MLSIHFCDKSIQYKIQERKLPDIKEQNIKLSSQRKIILIIKQLFTKLKLKSRHFKKHLIRMYFLNKQYKNNFIAFKAE
jgi:hypothetical protein